MPSSCDYEKRLTILRHLKLCHLAGLNLFLLDITCSPAMTVNGISLDTCQILLVCTIHILTFKVNVSIFEI